MVEEHKAVWKTDECSTYSPARPPGNVRADVAIVGAGITGLTTAELLSQAGLEVVVLEADDVGGGVTGQSTGHVTELVDARYSQVRRHFGEEAAQTLRQSAREALELMRELAGRYGGDSECDARHRSVPAFLYAEDPSQLGALNEEAEAAHLSGIPAERIDEMPLPFPTQAGIRVPDQAEIDPLAYIRTLARALEGRAEIHKGARVVEIDHGAPCRLVTEHGTTVEAHTVILATHTPPGFHPIQTMVAPYRSYALGFPLSKDEFPEGLFFDLDEPYHYLRTFTRGRERLLIVGGADHKTGHEADRAPYEELENYARERIDLGETRFRWSAEFFEPADGLPYIGASPLQARMLLATGFSGDGLLFGTVAGILLAALAQGIDHPWSSLYRPSRFGLRAAGPTFVRENADAAARFIGDRLKPHQSSPEEIGPGGGAVLRLNGKLTAVHRDANGNLHRLSAVCTHLRCVVEWNHSDSTWDCPCHGARFHPTGEVLNGPATAPLNPA